jgi:hypothetical protein
MRTPSIAFLVAAAAAAQTNTGSITGTVFDAQQAVVAGVRVTATHLATNVSQTAATSSAGAYRLAALTPGNYRVTAELDGFKKLVREPVRVETSSVATLDLALEVGSTATEVLVRADAPLIQESSSTIQYSINQKQLDELPLANQSALQILSTLPGVLGEPGSEQASVTTGFVTPGGGLSVSGGRMGSTQYQADGVSNNAMFLGRISLSFSSDAIREVTVQQNAYSAEFGRVGGGIVSMTTKSGTNQLHGVVFSFSQNDKLNAAPYRNTFDRKGHLRYWRGGADVGGPVYIPKLYDGRNRTFFFAGFEPLRHYTQLSAFTRVPTELEREGDFSRSVYNTTANQRVYIFRQFEFNPNGSLSNQRIQLAAGDAYPIWEGGVIPKRFISPAGQKVAKLYPLPNMALNALGQNYSVFRHVRNTDNRYTIKLDQSITSANRMSFRFAQVPVKGDRAFLPGLLEQVPTDTSTGTNVALSDTHVWGGNKVNDLRLGFNRSNIARRESDEQLSKDWFKEFGFPSRLDRGFPIIGIGDGIFNPGTSIGNYEIDNFFQAVNIFNWTRGRNNLKAGFEFQAPQQNLIDYASVQGNWNFGSAMTNIGGSGNTQAVLGIANAQTGFGLASLLLGYPAGISMAPAVISYQYRWKYYAGFVQNDYKLTPRLTLNLGARYQVEVARSEKNHNQGYFVPEAVTNSVGQQLGGYIQLHGLGGAARNLWPTRYNNIEPRLGFAYRLPKVFGGLAVVRAAYAISHVPTNGLFRIPIPDLNPRPDQLATNGGVNGGWVQLESNPLALPSRGATQPRDGKLVDTQNVNQIYYLNRDVSIPYIQQWNFGLGFQFGKDYGLEVNYVGSKGTQLFGPSALYNTIDLPRYTQQFLAGENMGERLPNPAGLLDPSGNIVTVTRQDLLRGIPTMSSIGNPIAQGYSSSYNALQTNLVKRFSHGIQFTVNYTWMKSIDDSSCDGQFCNDNIQNWGTGFPQLRGGNRRLERSISVFSIPHVFRFNYNWDVPVKVRGWANQIVGNWKLSGLGQASSGLPLQAHLGNNAGFPDDVGRIRANLVPGVDPILPGWRRNVNNPVTQRAPYVNVLAALAPPDRLTIGNAPRVLHTIRMPRTESYNMAILKEFPVREQVKLAFRAELFGALNHPFFQTNGNNFVAYQNLDYQRFAKPPVTAANIAPAYADIGANIGGIRRMQLGLKLYF